jgi:hypothetical protein
MKTAGKGERENDVAKLFILLLDVFELVRPAVQLGVRLLEKLFFLLEVAVLLF